METIKSNQVSVLLIGPFDESFDYLIENNINGVHLGQIVLAPLGSRKIVGIILSEGSKKYPLNKLKKILHFYDLNPIPKASIELVTFLASWNCVFKGLVLKMLLNPLEAITSQKFSKIYKINSTLLELLGPTEAKKISPKRQIVLDTLFDSNKGMLIEDLVNKTGVSKSIINGMFKKGFIKEELVKEANPISIDIFEEDHIKSSNQKILNEHQKSAIKKINISIKENKSDCFLLDGVPGSGKTETYFDTVQTCLKEKKQILILLPEIALTPDWQKRFFDRFNFKPLIWHSDISKKKRKHIWLSALSGTASVIVGARSALMIPISNLGLIVIDEEHEPAFKQEESVRYNARDMAIYRANKTPAPIILASATPSLESFQNMKLGKYIHLTLPQRATGAELPEIRLLDLKSNPPNKGCWISPVLIDELKTKLDKKDQSLLFLNRRGYSPLRLCNSCGNKIKCKNCDTWLVEHRSKGFLICHHCGFNKKLSDTCETCGSNDHMHSFGPGVERITEEVKKLFPDARVLTLSSDTMNSQKLLAESIDSIKQGKVDIIIGTQMIAKGHDFPNLKLVGIIDGDIGLSGGDLRASERSFQLLQQVSGRSGRHISNSDDKGLVILQTFDPENPILKAIASNDRDNFFKNELISRKNAGMPPFGRLAAIILSSKSEKQLDIFALKFSYISPSFHNIKIFGPAPAPLHFLRGKYRRRFLIKSSKTVNLQQVILEWVNKIKTPSSIKLTIDIDPYSFM